MQHNYNFNNEYQTIISSTEPTTDRKKVWMQKTKNIVDMNVPISNTLISDTGAISSNSLWNLL